MDLVAGSAIGRAGARLPDADDCHLGLRTTHDHSHSSMPTRKTDQMKNNNVIQRFVYACAYIYALFK